MWVRANGSRVMDSREITEYIDKLDKGIVILDGPSGCGKTTIIRSIKTEGKMILSAEFLNRIIADSCKSNKSYYEIMYNQLSAGKIVCLEDVDLMLRGKQASIQLIREIMKELEHDHVFVLTGIQLSERVSDLIDREITEYYLWSE